ncbi:hypothetical protein V565_042320, partial [Rhizoctonia solani 123E]
VNAHFRLADCHKVHKKLVRKSRCPRLLSEICRRAFGLRVPKLPCYIFTARNDRKDKSRALAVQDALVKLDGLNTIVPKLRSVVPDPFVDISTTVERNIETLTQG